MRIQGMCRATGLLGHDGPHERSFMCEDWAPLPSSEGTTKSEQRQHLQVRLEDRPQPKIDLRDIGAPMLNEEASEGTVKSPEPKRCPICDWPIVARGECGCWEGSCSYRPHEGTAEYSRIQKRRAKLKSEIVPTEAAKPHDKIQFEKWAVVRIPDGPIFHWIESEHRYAHELYQIAFEAYLLSSSLLQEKEQRIKELERELSK